MHFTIDEKGNIGNCNCTPEQVEFCLKALNDHGITIDDISDIMAIGVSGIAISGTVLQASDPVSEMQKIVRLINKINN